MSASPAAGIHIVRNYPIVIVRDYPIDIESLKLLI